VTLRLDDSAAASVERIWRVLADHTGDNDVLRLGYAPHITLAVLPDVVSAEVIEEVTFPVASTWDAIPIVLAGLGVFPGTPPVVWAAPIVTESLLARHDALLAALAPFRVHPHYLPGAWVPHVTLSQQGLSPAGRAIDVAASVWEGPINGQLDRIDLVKFHPAYVLRTQALQPSG
jgi:2'-5' RNA ligase